MDLVDRVLHGERRAMARCITLIEGQHPTAWEIVTALYPHTGRAQIIGITGPPGTGKSTLVNGLARAYRQRGVSVGIIAVDPTSPFTGGALLGDRIRMRDLAGDAGIFVRSMATRGSLGGLARATADAIKVLDAAGLERIMVETVGVGQAEVDVAQAAHTTVVLQTPNMGDDIQALKAGLIEIADIFVVNKADRDGADQAVRELQAVLGLGTWPGQEALRWRPPVLKAVAPRQQGMEPLLEQIEAHGQFLRTSGAWAKKEEARARQEVEAWVQQALLTRFWERIPQAKAAQITRRVAARELAPQDAVKELSALAGMHPGDRPHDTQGCCQVQAEM